MDYGGYDGPEHHQRVATVQVGKMMVQIHMLKVRLEKYGVTVSEEELERAASSASAASLLSARRASKSLTGSPGRVSPAESSPGRAVTPTPASKPPAAATASPEVESSTTSSTAFHDIAG